MGSVSDLPPRDSEVEYGLFEPTVRGEWVAPIPSSSEPLHRGSFASCVLELSRRTDWTLIRVFKSERWQALSPEGYEKVRQGIERHVTARRVGEFESGGLRRQAFAPGRVEPSR
jgi:hypothetical protein